MTTSVSIPGVSDMEDHRKTKLCLKWKVGEKKLVLTQNIQLNDIAAMQNETLVGRFVSKRLSTSSL
jgi:hypothetical protein